MDKDFCFILSQNHTPLVKVGDKIRKGQKICTGNGLSTNLHSSISGKVSNITPDFINIIPFSGQQDEPEKILDFEDHLSLIKEAGIVGAGGAGFPTHLKYGTKIEGGTIVGNGAECEPLHSHNLTQIINNPGLLIKGLEYVMGITLASRGVIAIKKKHGEAWNILERELRNKKSIQLAGLPDKYPIGEERALAREIFGIELSPGELPFEKGFLVNNVETLANVVKAIDERLPVISKNLTLAGQLGVIGNVKTVVQLPIGKRIGAVLEDFGGILEPHGEIIVNGPFMGFRGKFNTPITKTTNSIIVTQPFPKIRKRFGLLICACGGSENRLREIVDSMEGCVISFERCKRSLDIGRGFKCEKPGCCPGQAEKVLSLRKAGAEALLVGTCSECTQTVMEIAPKIGLEVIHQADHILEGFGFTSFADI